MREQIGCVLLAGGLATRMGGGDKGFKCVDGQLIIERVIACVAPQVDKLVINANGDASRFDHLGFPVISDPVAGHVGPLAGILAGMQALKAYDYILSVPTDTPFLPHDLVERLMAPIKEGTGEIVIARSGGFDHPVVGIWPTSLSGALERALVEEDVRKMKKWIARYRYQTVEWAVEEKDPFFNANHPEDLISTGR